jgi:hypothetical protein
VLPSAIPEFHFLHFECPVTKQMKQDQLAQRVKLVRYNFAVSRTEIALDVRHRA